MAIDWDRHWVGLRDEMERFAAFPVWESGPVGEAP